MSADGHQNHSLGSLEERWATNPMSWQRLKELHQLWWSAPSLQASNVLLVDNLTRPVLYGSAVSIPKVFQSTYLELSNYIFQGAQVVLPKVVCFGHVKHLKRQIPTVWEHLGGNWSAGSLGLAPEWQQDFWWSIEVRSWGIFEKQNVPE